VVTGGPLGDIVLDVASEPGVVGAPDDLELRRGPGACTASRSDEQRSR
jgi:hypothetical protein